LADDIEVHYDPRRGELSLSCGNTAFARLRSAVIAEAAVDKIILGTSDHIRHIEITSVPVVQPPARFIDRTGLLACGVLGFVLLFVLLVGASTIVGWIR
jgi:hypothetical protein